MPASESRFTKAACYVLIAGLLSLLLVKIRLIFSYSLNTEGAEFLFVHFVQILYHKQPLYQNPEVFPFHSVLYTPIYTYILFGLVKLCGINPISQVHAVYVLGRGLSLLFLILNLEVLNRFMLLFNSKLFPRLLAIFLFTLLMSGHIFAARSDSLQLLCFTLFLYFICKYFFFEAKPLWLACTIFFALMAIFSKQESAIHIFILVAALCIYERTRRAYLFFAAFSIIALAALGIAYLIFGPFLFINTVIYNIEVLTELKKTYNIEAIGISLVRMLPLALLVCYLVYREIKTNGVKSSKIFIATLALCYLVITHIMMLRAAASINYGYPASLMLVISFAILYDDSFSPVNRHMQFAYACAGVYITALVLSNYIMGTYIFKEDAEAINKQQYTTLLSNRADIDQITKNDTLFILNARYTPLFDAQPLVFGYDKHIDRLIEILSGQQVHSRMLFIPTDKYDNVFNTGEVKYILAENNEISTRQIRQYYKRFHFYSTVGKFTLYKYASTAGAD